MDHPTTLASLLRRRAAEAPASPAYGFLSGSAATPVWLSYGTLDERARAVARRLQQAGIAPGATVLVVFPPGLEFLAGFFGCLHAGVIAVPCRSPGPRDSLDGLAAVAADAGAAAGLTSRSLLAQLSGLRDALPWLATEEVDPGLAAEWQDPDGTVDAVAYLQYTSGSTATPKGVVLRHAQVLANCRDTERHLAIDRASRFLSWLPQFHDFGLVFGRLQPLYSGCLGLLMAPAAFAQRPLRWLEAIAQHRITHSGAPNFAYRSCAAIPEAQRAGLDLACWRVAINGAEPVRASTIEAFTKAFAPQGFAAEALCPGYGMAEATLIASVSEPGRRPIRLAVDAAALRAGRLVPADAATERPVALIGSGQVDVEARIRIVDPASGTPCDPGEIGEIWLAGEAIAAGYWNRPDATAARFGARIAGDAGRSGAEGGVLRSRDLGAVLGGELFVLGRMDDVIIIRGVNYAAEDLELALEGCDAALAPGGGAVFAVDVADEPWLVVAHEVDRQAWRSLDADRVVRAILRRIAEQHGLEVAAVALLRPRSLPRTHSGKTQRHACRRHFLERSLRDVTTWLSPRLDAIWAAGTTPPAALTLGRSEPQSRAQQKEDPMQSFDADACVAGTVEPNPDRSPVKTAQALAAESAEDICAWLRVYAGQRINSFVMDERRTIPPYVVLDFGNRGLLGLQAPRRLGGLDLDNRSLARVIEQLGGIDLTLGSFVTVNAALGLRPILRHASEATRQEWLPHLASGRALAAFAMTEPGAGSHVRGIAAAGRPDGAGGWRLYGTKIWSGSAAWAGVINTFVRSEGGVSGFVVPQGRPGLHMGPEALTMGLRAMVQNDVRLDGVAVTEQDLLGRAGDGMAAAMETMEFGRFCIAALSLGVIRRCLQLMLRHAGRRSVSTGTLLANPLTLTRISELSAAASAVEALVGLVGDRLDRGLAVPAEIFCACKTTGPEWAWWAADHLVQQLAGRGYVETNLAPQILRDTRILRIFEGPTEPMHMHIGSKLVHSPEALRAFIGRDLGQPTLGAELEVAAARILERCLAVSASFADSTAARHYATLLAGEVGAAGILLAAVREANRKAPSPALRRAETWARLAFDRRLAEALGTSPAEAVLLDAAQAADLAADCAAHIGDIEQSLPGAGLVPDPLLARDGTRPQPAASALAEAAPVPAPAAPPVAAEDPIAAWLIAWTAEAFDRPPASIQATDRFSEFGLDSVRAVMLINAVEDWLGIDVSRTLVWDYPSIAAMAAHLAALTATQPQAPAAQAPAACVARTAAAASAMPAAPSAPPERRRSGHKDDIALLGQIDQLSESDLAAMLAQFQEAGTQ